MKNPSYLVLARKYRPQGFEQVLGQPAVSQTIRNSLASKRWAHAYLFTGPRGVGKTTMARILAKALNCAKGPTPEPCGTCDPCREIALSSCLDVLEMDAASHTGVDHVRQVILDTVGLAPSRDRFKIFIIDEAHMLSGAAFNALLKTLEEPPSHVVFILATTESAKVPGTIVSRCQRFRFRPVPSEVLSVHLGALAKSEKIDIEPEALGLLARSAEGSLRDAVSLLDQCHCAQEGRISKVMVREMFGFIPEEMLAGLARALFQKNAQALGQCLSQIYEEGLEPAQLLRDLRGALQEVHLEKRGIPMEPAPLLREDAQALSAEALAFLLRRVNRILEELRLSDSPRLALEVGLFSCLDAAMDLSQWVERLEGLERRLSSGGASFKAPPVELPSQPAPAQARVAAATQAAIRHAAEDAWPQVLEALMQEKAALAATLGKARLVCAGQSCKIFFDRSFDLDQAKRSMTMIVDKLATILGHPVRLEFELGGKSTAGLSEVVDGNLSSGAPEPAAPPGQVWKDVTEAQAAPAAGPLQKAQEILGGKVRVVKKPQ
ncbi:MAG: DNA polymerase III subunit gamma/tau [Elusimicrobia bacterium]|nr:DNA polymerase III subunit gamma/tau [Elusimicrobiota bacterium]